MRALRSFFEVFAAPRPPCPEALRILVVDDEPSVIAYVNRILTRAGYRPALASNGPEAVRLAAGMDGLDVLVTDLMMPRMNGDELAATLRGSLPNLKVLYQTGYCDRLFAEQTMLADGEAFIEKPYTIGGFEEAVALLVYGVTRFPISDYRAPAVWTA